MEMSESKLSATRVPEAAAKATATIGKHLLCDIPQSDETLEGMIRFVTYPPNHATDTGNKVLLADTIAPLVISANNVTNFEIINKTDLTNKYGTSRIVMDALSRCRSIFSRVGIEWFDTNRDEKDFFLVKEFERHLKMVQNSHIHAEIRGSTCAIIQRVKEASELSPRPESNDEPLKKKAKNILTTVTIPNSGILNCVPSPESTSLKQDNESSHNSNSFGGLKKITPGTELNDHPNEKNPMTNSDTASVPFGGLRKLTPGPELNDHPNEKNPMTNSDTASVPFGGLRKLTPGPELNDHPNEKNPMTNSDTANVPNILNCVPSPENSPQGLEQESANSIKLFAGSGKLSAGPEINNEAHEKNSMTNSDTASVPNILNCAPSPENSPQELEQESAHSIKLFADSGKLSAGPEMNNEPHEKNPMMFVNNEPHEKNPMVIVKNEPHEENPMMFLDTPSATNILNCTPRREDGLQTQQRESAYKILSPGGSKYQRLWEQRYRELVQYVEEFGHTRVPCQFSLNPALGVWVRHQRTNYKNYQKGHLSTRITPSRIELLNNIGFEWDCNVHSWEQTYSQLIKFVEEFGHTRVPQRYKENPLLAFWVSIQRKNYKLFQKGVTSICMTEKKVELLENIGFEWDLSSPPWERRYYELVRFHKEFGHSRVPRSFAPNPSLGKWVTTQRVNYKNYKNGGDKPGGMTENRIKLLNKLGFMWAFVSV